MKSVRLERNVKKRYNKTTTTTIKHGKLKRRTKSVRLKRYIKSVRLKRTIRSVTEEKNEKALD